MINGFTSVEIAVPDLASARAEYDILLGGLLSRPDGASVALANAAIGLREDPALEAAQITGLALWSEEGEAALPADCRGLDLSVTTTREVSPATTLTGIKAVDHVVLRSRDADDCIRLFNADLGMRLALDQAVPEWGGRMLFFRCGKLTLEVIQHLDDPVGADHFWGITFLVEDLPTTLALLDERGVQHSELREGRKAGTVVATVKSHHLGLPTLLIQPLRQ